MTRSYRATGFTVIQEIYAIADEWYIRDYIGRVYRFEDVTDDGLLFLPSKGWIQMFFLDEDQKIIRDAASVIDLVCDSVAVGHV
jgi:hypothetical protein